MGSKENQNTLKDFRSNQNTLKNFKKNQDVLISKQVIIYL